MVGTTEPGQALRTRAVENPSAGHEEDAPAGGATAFKADVGTSTWSVRDRAVSVCTQPLTMCNAIGRSGSGRVAQIFRGFPDKPAQFHVTVDFTEHLVSDGAQSNGHRG